jgi:hypothetical protein
VSYETNRNAALAANMLVHAQLEIRSGNRPGDNRNATFMAKLEQEKTAITDRLMAPEIEKAKKLRVDISALTQEAGELKRANDRLWQPEPSVGGQQLAVPELSLEEKKTKSKSLLSSINQKWVQIKKLSTELEPLGTTNTRQDIEITAQASVNKRRGNCDEMSSIAFLWLASTSVRPIELLETYENASGDKHQFVVIGRPDTADLNDPDVWTREAVVCDPWLDDAYAAAELPTRLTQIGYPDMWLVRSRDD